MVTDLPEKGYTPGLQEGCTLQEGYGYQQGYKGAIILHY